GSPATRPGHPAPSSLHPGAPQLGPTPSGAVCPRRAAAGDRGNGSGPAPSPRRLLVRAALLSRSRPLPVRDPAAGRDRPLPEGLVLPLSGGEGFAGLSLVAASLMSSSLETIAGGSPGEAPGLFRQSAPRDSSGRSVHGPILEVRGLKKHFPLRRGLFGRAGAHLRAVDGID